MWLFKMILIVAVASVAILAIAYVVQTRMVFPTWIADQHEAHLPETAIRLSVETSNGVQLRGVHVPAETVSVGRRTVLLGFGGNAWNADSLAEYLHELMPDLDVVAFHYRGYKPSGGRPSAAALLKDAPVIRDYVAETLGDVDIIAVGFSIGSGVAAYLAAERSVAGLIMVSPFDSLTALALEHHPLIGRLLYHKMDTADYLRRVTAPTAIIAAERDMIVPLRRTVPLLRVAPNLVFDDTIANADHNDLYMEAAFIEAMREAIERIQSARTAGSPTASAETSAPAHLSVQTEPNAAG